MPGNLHDFTGDCGGRYPFRQDTKNFAARSLTAAIKARRALGAYCFRVLVSMLFLQFRQKGLDHALRLADQIKRQ